MKVEKTKLGNDLSNDKGLYCDTLIWEQDKETAEEFLEACKNLHPEKERHIMFRCVKVYYSGQSVPKPKENVDDFYARDTIQSKTPKKRRA
jgi:hypothetical protein